MPQKAIPLVVLKSKTTSPLWGSPWSSAEIIAAHSLAGGLLASQLSTVSVLQGP